MAEFDPKEKTESTAASTHAPSTAKDDEVAVLATMATQAAASTKIVASWLLALAVFGFFGILQTHWKVVQQRPELSDLTRKINDLKQQIEKQHPDALSLLLRKNSAAFDDLPLRLEYAKPAQRTEQDHVRRVTVDICTALELRPAPAASAGPPKLPQDRGAIAESDVPQAARGAAPTRQPEPDATETPLKPPPRQGSKGDSDVRLAARSHCKQIIQKEQTVEKLEERRRKLQEALNEVSLKTPLFETKVATMLAPPAQLVLLAAAIYYLDRKRRELASEYLRAVKLAGLDVEGPHPKDRIDAFNREVRKSFGAAPLWLLPFPSLAALPIGLEVQDTFGRDARGKLAKRLALVSAGLIVFYALSLFTTAVSVDIAVTAFGDAGRDRFSVGLHFLTALALTCWVIYVTVTALLPWRHDPAVGVLPGSRRRMLIATASAYAVLVPVAAAATGRHAWLRTRLPHDRRLHWLRQLANAVLPGQARERRHLRWQSRWHLARLFRGFSTDQLGFVKRPPKPKAHSNAVAQVRYLFSTALRSDKMQWFGAPWTSSRPVELMAAGEWAKTYLENPKTAPQIERRAASLSIEVAALDRFKAGDLDGAFQLLEVGRRRLDRNFLSSAQSIRIYDLSAAMALRHGKKAVLLGLIDTARKYAANGAPPEIEQRLAKYVGDRARLRRRRERRSSSAEDRRFLAELWRQRANRWSNSKSSWHKKWSDPKKVWKLGIAEPHKATRGRREEVGNRVERRLKLS